MEKPALVILAAGMGSRYGGLKQIDAVGANGELLIDYSIYDAIKAGFEKVVFIITRRLDADFREVIGDRIAKYAETAYAYQELDALPAGFTLPEGRTKPWGTVHALLCARERIDGPFAVINADDFYGASAYRTIYNWLTTPRANDGKHHYAMVGYMIENTVPEAGTVTRGVCEADAKGFLTGVTERRMIEKTAAGARFSEDKGATWTDIPAGTLVSMNFWGLDETFMDEAERGFAAYLSRNLAADPMKCEYVLPTEVDRQVREGAVDVEVLRSADEWFGVTYREDHPVVMKAVAKMHAEGVYPLPLWRAL